MGSKAYTEKQEELLIELYSEYGSEGINEIADILGKKRRSVIAKLTKMELYVAPTKQTKVSIKQKIERIEEILGVEFDANMYGDKSLNRKSNVRKLVEGVEEMLGIE